MTNNFRTFIITLILIFGLQSSSMAEDIKDFEIEGVSVGDSLLKYMSEEAILDDLEYIYPNDGFWAVTYITNKKFENYENVLFHGKKNDSNYYIHSITGDLFFSNTSECLEKKKEINTTIKNAYPNIFTEDIKKKHENDSMTTTYTTWYDFESGSIAVACYDWSKKSGHKKTTKVTIDSKEFLNWLNYKAYD